MTIALITGSTGLIGSEAAVHFGSLGMEVVVVDFWWNGSNTTFETDHPSWTLRYDVPAILQGIFAAHEPRWTT